MTSLDRQRQQNLSGLSKYEQAWLVAEHEICSQLADEQSRADVIVASAISATMRFYGHMPRSLRVRIEHDVRARLSDISIDEEMRPYIFRVNRRYANSHKPNEGSGLCDPNAVWDDTYHRFNRLDAVFHDLSKHNILCVPEISWSDLDGFGVIRRLIQAELDAGNNVAGAVYYTVDDLVVIDNDCDLFLSFCAADTSMERAEEIGWLTIEALEAQELPYRWDGEAIDRIATFVEVE